MGEFSETSMPEPDFSADVPDVEPSADIVMESPAEAEPPSDFADDSASDTEPSADVVDEMPVLSEPPSDMALEPEASTDLQPETEPSADTLSLTEQDAGPEPEMEPDPALEGSPESQYELSPELPVESDPSWESLPETVAAQSPEIPVESGSAIEGVPESQPEPTPEIPLETEPSAESLPETSPEMTAEPPMEQEIPLESLDQSEPDFPPVMPPESEPSAPPYEEPDPYHHSVEDVDHRHSPEDAKVEPGAGLDKPQDGSHESELRHELDAERNTTIDTQVPSDAVDTKSVGEQSDLNTEGISERSQDGTPNDSAAQAPQESSPKFYLDGKEATLPGDGEREYRIGSPHQDFEVYKQIVDAERQHDLGIAAQTSDSFGEAAGTLVEAQQGDTDFTEVNNYMYEKHGHEPYTDPAYSQSENSSPSDAPSDSQSSVDDGTASLTDSPLPAMPVDTTSFKDSQERNITVKRWGDENLIQLRAYDTDMGAVPENPNIGTAGMTNLQIETTPDGSTQIRLQDIVVPPDYRKSGIAGNMLDQTVAIAKAKGAGEIHGVIENDEALSYWKHMEAKGTGWKVDSSQGAYGQVRYALDSEVKKK